MKLQTIVAAIVEKNGVKSSEIVATVEYLLRDGVSRDRRTILRIGRIVKAAVDYEKERVS